MNLDEMQRVAEEATAEPTTYPDHDPEGWSEYIGRRRRFERTFDPPTVLKLLAVLRAAEARYCDSDRSECGCAQCRVLDVALRDLREAE